MTETDRNRPESLSARVRRGVALLDEKVPGWHQRVGPDLNMGYPHTDVLGKVFGSFYRGRLELGLSSGDSRALGFEGDEEVPWRSWASVVRGDETLTRLWRFVVRQRQAAALRNLNADSDYDRALFADHLVRVSVDELPVGAR
ncbi:hypothetical protein [Amycolatopsis speibonae]|uniref:Uncharacterized protein n=1 Tax=Amycolatopsis speibonae TaxID=1450224 RepID=A0ABV7P4P3_9PSEU